MALISWMDIRKISVGIPKGYLVFWMPAIDARDGGTPCRFAALTAAAKPAMAALRNGARRLAEATRVPAIRTTQ
jgi:hypothetical protein